MLRVEVWMTTTFFAVGIIAAMTYVNWSTNTAIETMPASDSIVPASGDVPEFARPAESEQTGALSDSGKTSLQMGDRYLLAGNYSLALDNYYSNERAGGQTETAIVLRQAFCLEQQKQYEVAQKKYYRASNLASNANHRLLGLAGLARCLSHTGHQPEALEMLAEQVLKLDLHSESPEEVRAELDFEFAAVLSSFAVDSQQDLTAPMGLAFEDSSPRPEHFLSAVDQPATTLAAETKSPSDFSVQVLQRPSPSLNVMMLSISARQEPILVSLAQIANATELELFASKSAQEILKDRSRTIELKACPASSVLDALLVSFDLVWYQIDSAFYIVARHEVDPQIPENQFWFEVSLRTLRRFELNYPEDARRPAALLSSANLNLLQNKYDVAATEYQELSQAQPEDEILAKFFFNQAKLQMLLGRNTEANRLLYFAIDQTINPDIESSSYCLLGANQLSAGELDDSITSSRRGVATAINLTQQRKAALNLARAYLLNNDPFSANNALFQNRSAFEDATTIPAYQDSTTTVASLLGAYAQFIGVSDQRGIKTARSRLLSALAMMPDSEYESFVDCYVASQAFEQLGFRNKAINKLLLALARPDVGQWKRQILLELAILQKRSGLQDQAMVTLQSLVEFEDQWTPLALKELAEIFADTNQAEQCIETCKKLWQADLSEGQKRSALQILGQAYQQRGEHHSAALCFAGILPGSF